MTSSDSSVKPVSVALGIAAAAALGVAAYARWKKSTNESQSAGHKSGKYPTSGPITKKQLSQLLDEILTNQQQMNAQMDKLQQEIIQSDWTFAQACAKVQEAPVPSTLEEHQISVKDFGKMLNAHNSDPEIRAKIGQLTSGSVSGGGGSSVCAGGENASGGAVKPIELLVAEFSMERVIDVHSFMLASLKNLMEGLDSEDSKYCFQMDSRLATIAAQAYVGKLVYQNFGLSCEQLEALAKHYHAGLTEDDRFHGIGSELRYWLNGLAAKCSKAKQSKSVGENVEAKQKAA